MLKILYIMMIIFAIISIQTNALRNAIIYLGIFSFLCSFCYLLLKAPDVAIAEAVIACTLSTVLYLVALKRYRIVRIYFCNKDDSITTAEKNNSKNILSKVFQDYAHSHELELDFVNTNKTIDFIINNNAYDIIVDQSPDNTLNIYGEISNYHFEQLISFTKNTSDLKVHFQDITPDASED